MKYKQLIICLIFVLFTLTSQVFADGKTRNITATGRGEVFIPQTIASVQLSVSVDGKSALEVGEAVKIKSAKLLNVLKAEKLLSIERSTITVSPIMSYTNNTPKIIGYNANYGVQVKSNIQDMGIIIDHAVSAGALIVDEPKLLSSDAQITQAEKEAIKLATLDAKSKAMVSLNTLGFKATTVSQITVQNNNNRPTPMNFAVMKSNSGSMSTPQTQIIAGKTSIVAEVSLTMEY